MNEPAAGEPLPDSGADLTIEQVSRLIGLPTATIRSWERRYGVPVVARTAGGHRRYTREQLDTLRRVRELSDQGRRLADAAAQAAAELATPPEVRIKSFLQAAVALQPDGMAEVLDAAEQALGPGRTVDEVLLPALRQIGAWWQETGTGISHEHLATQATQSWLARMGTAVPAHDQPPAVLCCGPSDTHTLALEALAALLRVRGCDCRLLGARTPAAALAEAVRNCSAGAAVVVAHLAEGRDEAVQSLRTAERDVTHLFYAGGAFASPEDRQQVPGRYLGDNLTRAAELVSDCLRGA